MEPLAAFYLPLTLQELSAGACDTILPHQLTAAVAYLHAENQLLGSPEKQLVLRCDYGNADGASLNFAHRQ